MAQQSLLSPGLPQKRPPFFSVFSPSISVLLLLGSVMFRSGRLLSILSLVFPLVLYNKILRYELFF